MYVVTGCSQTSFPLQVTICDRGSFGDHVQFLGTAVIRIILLVFLSLPLCLCFIPNPLTHSLLHLVLLCTRGRVTHSLHSTSDDIGRFLLSFESHPIVRLAIVYPFTHTWSSLSFFIFVFCSSNIRIGRNVIANFVLIRKRLLYLFLLAHQVGDSF